MQSAQAISAAYYFDVAARDYSLAAGAIELIIEGVPCSVFIEPSQSCELIFCARLDRLQGRKHAGDGGKFRRDLQEQSRHTMKGESVSCPRLIQSGAHTWRRQEGAFWSIAKSVCEARKNSRATIKIGNQTVMNRVQDGGLAALAPANSIGRKTKQQTITRVLRKLETSLTITASEPALFRR